MTENRDFHRLSDADLDDIEAELRLNREQAATPATSYILPAEQMSALVEEVRASRAILLAIGAEDWNDETLPLIDGKMQGIGPCARARRFLGLEYRGAVDKRRAQLAKVPR